MRSSFGTELRGGRLRRLGPTPQHFRDAPGLRDTAPRRKGRFRIKNLADRADTRLAQVLEKSCQQRARAAPVLGMDLQPSVAERADQPAPHGSLMIGRVPRAQVAVILGLVFRMTRRQR